MVCQQQLFSWLWLALTIMPGFAAYVWDLSKLKKTTIPMVTNAAKPLQLHREFNHNASACVYRFHDYEFMSMKQVVLSNDDDFQNRTECSVEFFNLPQGVFYVRRMGQQPRELRRRRNNDTLQQQRY